MNLDQRQEAVIRELLDLPSPHARLEYLMEQAAAAPPLDPAWRTEDHEVEGCMATLWLVSSMKEGRCRFDCDSDSRVVKSIAHLLCRFYSDAEPGDILAHPPSFLAETGITAHLTPNRRNALSRVWSTICTFAERNLEKESQ